MKKGRKPPDEMTFLEHLEDLRKRLFRSFIALFVGLVPAWFFHKELFDILAQFHLNLYQFRHSFISTSIDLGVALVYSSATVSMRDSGDAFVRLIRHVMRE